MFQRRISLKQLFKSKKAVSQILSAVMMILMLMGAIAVVFGYLMPSYRQFQTNNAVNSITSYMLRVDGSIYSLLAEGEGSLNNIRVDPFYGYYSLNEGRNISFVFSDNIGTYNQSILVSNLGTFTFKMTGRTCTLIDNEDSLYLKGPNVQPFFIVNGSSSTYYQGLTYLLLSRNEYVITTIDLSYRVNLYYWFDQGTNELSIIINLIILEAFPRDFYINSYHTLNIFYNRTINLFSDQVTVTTDFNVLGLINNNGLIQLEHPLSFIKPIILPNYDVNIDVLATYISYSI